MIRTPSVDCPSQETEETQNPTRPVENFALTTKGLQERTQHWMVRRWKNRFKNSIVPRVFPSAIREEKNMNVSHVYIFMYGGLGYWLKSTSHLLNQMNVITVIKSLEIPELNTKIWRSPEKRKRDGNQIVSPQETGPDIRKSLTLFCSNSYVICIQVSWVGNPVSSPDQDKAFNCFNTNILSTAWQKGRTLARMQWSRVRFAVR